MKNLSIEEALYNNLLTPESQSNVGLIQQKLGFISNSEHRVVFLSPKEYTELDHTFKRLEVMEMQGMTTLIHTIENSGLDKLTRGKQKPIK